MEGTEAGLTYNMDRKMGSRYAGEAMEGLSQPNQPLLTIFRVGLLKISSVNLLGFMKIYPKPGPPHNHKIDGTYTISRQALLYVLCVHLVTSFFQYLPSATAQNREMDITDQSKPCQGQIRIVFQNEELASMVKECMDVDDELQPARLTKDIVVEGHSLLM